jgi:2-phospho-L-lactate guanylyltransferase
MQASVHRFDPEAGTGAMLLDDGTELPFDREAFERSGLRLVRVGQRLTIETDDDRVVAMRLHGI